MAAKRARLGPKPEELTTGVLVVYGDDQREGIVSDAFAPLNEFWIKDRASGQYVREDGDIVAFSAEQLRILGAGEPKETQAQQSARVLLIGTERQMMEIIKHFGDPDTTERRDPQMLLALPCCSCSCGPSCSRFDADKRVTCAECCPLMDMKHAIEPAFFDLARSLRPDLEEEPRLRAYHLKQALEQLGPDLPRLEEFYCLSAVQMPYGLHEIEAASWQHRRHMEEVCCEIDMNCTAEGPRLGDEESLDRTARRVLGETCGVSLAERIWDDKVQTGLRKVLGVDLPLRYWDGDTKGFVLLLPSDLEVSRQDAGLLHFKEPRAAAGAAAGTGVARDAKGAAGQPPASASVGEPSADNATVKNTQVVGGKTIGEWKADQDQFKHLPKLPANWIRIKSRSSSDVYFYNTKTDESTFEHPLPPGWKQHRSKTNNKVYYFNASLNKSVYQRPTE